MKRLILITVLIIVLGGACRENIDQSAAAPPLVDTLMTVLADLSEIVKTNQMQELMGLIDPDEAGLLQARSKLYGYSSLADYLRIQLDGWPDPDTLQFADIRLDKKYARLTLKGLGGSFGRKEQRIRYTFLLFKMHHSDWKIVAMTKLEKAAHDRYGNEITYFETDLPPKLRFPRAF